MNYLCIFLFTQTEQINIDLTKYHWVHISLPIACTRAVFFLFNKNIHLNILFWSCKKGFCNFFYIWWLVFYKTFFSFIICCILLHFHANFIICLHMYIYCIDREEYVQNIIFHIFCLFCWCLYFILRFQFKIAWLSAIQTFIFFSKGATEKCSKAKNWFFVF